MVVEAYQDRAFQKIINNANILAPDGRPISIFLSHFEKQSQERVCGMDMLPDLLKESEILNKSVFFLGGTNELLSAVIDKAKRNYPSLRIAGYFSPPFRNLSAEENSYMTTIIREAEPDLVFVSLGCPKQEKWMAANKDKIGACLLGVGQAFTTFAGLEKRLPIWMRNLSLEWLYRLYQEPKRLWKRYLFTNSYFMLLVFKEIFYRLTKRTQRSEIAMRSIIPLDEYTKNGKRIHP
jgi:N-acetylglucosaminyldiphosphoundecaprenol N-acetyl-beta-D-mannosaminyltransferase